MANNKLFTNLITGTAIAASLTTGGVAGLKVLANRNVEVEVPEVSVASPLPSVSPSANPSVVPGNSLSVEPIVEPSIVPSSMPINSEFPVASVSPRSRFDDDDDSEDEEENELKHKDDDNSEDHDQDD